MIAPTIHLNGTGRTVLLNEYRQAVEAVRTAEKIVREVTVHGRDYYVQDHAESRVQGESYQIARAQMDNLLERLGDIERELERTYYAIGKQ